MITSPIPVGVCVLDTPPPNVPRSYSYPQYIHEVLGHARLCYQTLQADSLHESLREVRLLVTVGEAQWPEETEAVLKAWLENGGAWLSIGGASGMPEAFGVRARKPSYKGVAWGGQSTTLGEGYLKPLEQSHPVVADVSLPLHFFNGTAFDVEPDANLLASTLDSHQHTEGYAGIVERRVGQGQCLLIAPDLIGAILRIQQGVSVTRDGVPARDGSAAVTDGVLKCDDGAVLDWIFDRQEVPNEPGLKAFLEPIADLWRNMLLRSICYLAEQRQVPLALLWYYPRNLPALAHLSHDSDHNGPEEARELLEVTAEVNVPATWCIILPGYENALIEAIRAGGHELATHYDAIDHPWSEDEFHSQWLRLCEQFGEQPVSNKNHYTRWEGDTEFFEWCRKRGILLDGSKGPSKWGESGFLFGTCHPYFPFAPNGDIVDVLELPFFTQDLEVFLTAAVVPPFIDGVLRANGVLHLLFHPAHIFRPGVADAIRNAAMAAREAGMEWWTSKQINDWERARRQVQWSATENSVTLQGMQTLPEATVLVFQPESKAVCINGNEREPLVVSRWGIDFSATVLDLQAGQPYTIDFA